MDMGPGGAGLARAQTTGTQSIIRMEPRTMKRVEAASIAEASLLGTLAYYSWGAGKNRIEGPSWNLAKSLMRCFGNCSLDMDPVQDLPDAWVFTARAVDHETGFSISRQFRQAKGWQVHGRFDEERKDDIRFQIGQSKALRNVALAFLPEWLVDRCLDQAKGGVREAIERAVDEHGMEKVVTQALSRLARLGVPEARVLGCMGRATVAAITVEDLVILRGSITAAEKGADTIDNLFPVALAEKKPGTLSERLKVKSDEAATGKVAMTPDDLRAEPDSPPPIPLAPSPEEDPVPPGYDPDHPTDEQQAFLDSMDPGPPPAAAPEKPVAARRTIRVPKAPQQG